MPIRANRRLHERPQTLKLDSLFVEPLQLGRLLLERGGLLLKLGGLLLHPPRKLLNRPLGRARRRAVR
jgi:hypothetical protein